MKKILLGLGAATATIAPIAAVVACGDTGSNGATTDSKTITEDQVKTNYFYNGIGLVDRNIKVNAVVNYKGKDYKVTKTITSDKKLNIENVKDKSKTQTAIAKTFVKGDEIFKLTSPEGVEVLLFSKKELADFAKLSPTNKNGYSNSHPDGIDGVLFSIAQNKFIIQKYNVKSEPELASAVKNNKEAIKTSFVSYYKTHGLTISIDTGKATTPVTFK